MPNAGATTLSHQRIIETILRSTLNLNPTALEAARQLQALATMAAQPTHEYWADAPDPLQFATLQSAALVGHRQVTDAYLLCLTAPRKQRLATLDRGLVSSALGTGLAANVELVSAQPMVQQRVTRYAVGRVKSRP